MFGKAEVVKQDYPAVGPYYVSEANRSVCKVFIIDGIAVSVETVASNATDVVS